MKNNLLLFFCYWLLMVTMIVTVSCTSSIAPQEQAGTASLNGTPTVTIEISVETASVATTLTSIPTLTSEPTLTATATNTPLPPTTTPSPSPTAMPVSTLTLEERETLVQELMTTNGGCQLPCWWGVGLGNNLENAGQMFNNLGLPGWSVTTSDLGDDNLMGSIISGYYDLADSFFYVGISLNFYTVNDVIQYIRVSASRPLRDVGEQEFVRDWQQYFLSSMLQEYGKPSQVYLIPQNIADPGPPDHALILFYPELGINVSYKFNGTWVSDTQAEVCLNLENVSQTNLSLYNPEFVAEWPTYLLPPEPASDMADFYEQSSWEMQTGMDLDAFYETYQNPNNLGCIQVTR